MAKIGGVRPGAGRKPGTLNKRTAELAADILGSGKSPLQYLLEVMMDEDADEKRRDWAAEKASAYIHPRPAPVPREIRIELPAMETVADIPSVIASVLRATGEGRMSPSEAQSLVSIIAAQRKAIETADLLKRIEDLEARAGNGAG